MKNEKLLLFILAIIQFTHIMDFMIVMPLGKQFMEIFAINPQQFSLIVSSYALSAFLSGILGAVFIDRLDRKKVLLFLYCGFATGTLACASSNSYFFFLISRCISGMFGGLLSAIVLSIIGDVFPYERRSSAIGIIMTAFSVASVVGVPSGIYLAAKFTWRMPFIIIGSLSILFIILAFFIIPSLQAHLKSGKGETNPFKILGNILQDKNQVKALVFGLILTLGHFSIIPFIAPYMQLNIGFSDFQVSYIYFAGGLFTAVLLPIFGRLADRFGNALVFSIASFFALFSIFAITNLPPVSIFVALCVSSSYFIVSSGRSVPALSMVTAVVRPESRGSFMSIRGSMNQLALGVGSLVAGLIVKEQADHSLINYQYVGYFAIVMSIVAVGLALQLKVAKGG
ncbi:MAG TPA: MFS transporter [Saprospiraceae bacterium]|nr:MFS transporter [Saprospiraceae bacterium]